MNLDPKLPHIIVIDGECFQFPDKDTFGLWLAKSIKNRQRWPIEGYAINVGQYHSNLSGIDFVTLERSRPVCSCNKPNP